MSSIIQCPSGKSDISLVYDIVEVALLLYEKKEWHS